jgi:GAF domain-containing protein
MFTEIEKGKTKEENYKILLENLQYFLSKDDEEVTTFSNLSAYLNYFLDDINWVGFYLYKDGELHLGPFQGLPACTKIKMGNGVCGTVASTKKTVIVEDVSAFVGHIACDSNSMSEIVVPIVRHHRLIGVLDIDSPSLKRFDHTDQNYLEKVIDKLVDIL